MSRAEQRVRTGVGAAGLLCFLCGFIVAGSWIGPAADLAIFCGGGLLLVWVAIPRRARPGVVAIFRRELGGGGTRDETEM
jgi:hypothetical protein